MAGLIALLIIGTKPPVAGSSSQYWSYPPRSFRLPTDN